MMIYSLKDIELKLILFNFGNYASFGWLVHMEGHVLYCIRYLVMGTHFFDNIYPELLFYIMLTLHVHVHLHACVYQSE